MPALRGLLSLSEVIPADPSLREHLSKYAGRFPQQVPEKYRDRYAYLTGRYFYDQLNIQQSVRMLEFVSQRSKFYARSRYILGITHVANYAAKPAVSAFKDTLRYLVSAEESGELDEEQNKLMELTRLAMARVFYSTGDYETSLKYYDKIGRDSPRWPQALFEKSWAFFQLDQYNKALGNLHSLNSPFFADSYFPEGPILASTVYFYNCKYERATNELDEFEFTYEPLKGKMQSVLDTNGDAASMFQWYQKLKKGDVGFSQDVYRIVEAAIDDKEVQAKFELVDLIDDEVQKIESMPKSWKNSPLGETLAQEASLARTFAVDDAGSTARQRLKRRVRKLTDLINQKKKILFEVARAQKQNIEADIRAEMNVSGNKTEAEKIEVSGEEMYWEFEGEYWRDEIGKYVFNINSQCKR
jgi:tetratricopeptide (TPR) repeat protein